MPWVSGHVRFCSYRQSENGFDDSVSAIETSVFDLILDTTTSRLNFLHWFCWAVQIALLMLGLYTECKRTILVEKVNLNSTCISTQLIVVVRGHVQLGSIFKSNPTQLSTAKLVGEEHSCQHLMFLAHKQKTSESGQDVLYLIILLLSSLTIYLNLLH